MDILVSRRASLPGDSRNGESRHPFGHPSLLGFQMIDHCVQGHMLHFEEPAVDGGDNLPPEFGILLEVGQGLEPHGRE